MNILVLCTGNSARSILLEAILNRDGGDHGIRAWSAGSAPAGRVHPQSLRLLSELDYPVAGLRSKSWDEFARAGAPVMDVVLTVCGSAAGETCPVWPGAPVRAHWGVEDPAAAAPGEQEAAFRAAYDLLRKRALAFLALDPSRADPAALRGDLVRIGSLT